MPLIERAVIFAAGEGRRLRPVTLTTPKPLIPVNGVRFIDTIIGALHANGIDEIYIVTGYMAGRYADLPARYPGVTLLHNPDYATCNNISSAFVAREHLENALVSEADLLIQNPAVCARDFTRSCYCALPPEHEHEWWLSLDASGTIVGCDTTGRVGQRQLIGVSCWTAEDARRLRRLLERTFLTEQTRDIYWDELALLRYPGAFSLGVREATHADIAEIDTLEELARADARYAPYLRAQA